MILLYILALLPLIIEIYFFVFDHAHYDEYFPGIGWAWIAFIILFIYGLSGLMKGGI